MYQALYRKYRPRRFGDVAGQEHITETLRRQIVSGRLSHAYLFVGTRGTGKTTCAKILSRAVNCLAPDDGEPCNKCTSCLGIEDGSILDVLELDAASNNSVDNVRALRDEAIYSPATVKKRVYIVDEVHMLSLSAFNALLKILEEPPEHILFILATTELHKVPATIQGRCQKFSFKRLPPAVLTARLNMIAASEGLTLTADAVERLSALADGSMRDGVSLLDQCASEKLVDLKCVLNTLGLTGHQEVSRLVDAFAERDVVSALGLLDDLYNDGRDMASLLGEMAILLRDSLVYQLSPDSGLLSAGFEHAFLSSLSKKMSPARLFYCLDVLKAAITALPRGGSSRLAVEMCILKMCDERLSDDSAAMLSRISRLEADEAENTLAGKVNSVAAKGFCDVEAVKGVDKVDLVKSDDEAVAVKSVDEADAVKSVDEAVAVKSDVEADVAAIDEVAAAGIDVKPVADDANFWSVVLEFLRSDPPVYALLSDSSKAQAHKTGDKLVVNVTDSFTASLIESDFSVPLKEAAVKASGHNIDISVVVGIDEPRENKHSKLESLSAFGIVDFK